MAEKGQVLGGRYTIIRLLGKGGTGSVYLASDCKLGKQWAVKEIKDRQAFSYLITEAGVLKRAAHPLLPAVMDIWEEAGCLYLLMEYVEGETLAAYIKREGTVPPELAAAWAIKLAEALGHLHGLTPPVCYGDMKPDNIMLTPDGRLRLIDFGTARGLIGNGLRQAAGTRGFAAPEQYVGHMDERTDIYALGMTLYAMLGGAAGGIGDQMPEIRAFIEKCTIAEPQRRYQSMKQVKEVLLSLQSRSVRYRRMQRGGRLAAAAMMFLLSMSCFTFAVHSYTDTNRQKEETYEAYIKQGDDYRMKQNLTKAAEQYYRAVHEVDGRRSEGYERLLALYVLRPDREESLQRLESSLPPGGRGVADRQRLLYQIGRAYFYPSRKYESALSYFSLVSEEQIPEAAYYRRLCALMPIEAGDSGQAYAVLEEFLQYNRRLPSAAERVANRECAIDIYMSNMEKDAWSAKKAEAVIRDGLFDVEEALLHTSSLPEHEEWKGLELRYLRKLFTVCRYLFEFTGETESYESAAAGGEEALELARELCEIQVEVIIRCRLAELYESGQEYEKALSCYESGEGYCGADGGELWLGHMRLLLTLYERTGEDGYREQFFKLCERASEISGLKESPRFLSLLRQREQMGV